MVRVALVVGLLLVLALGGLGFTACGGSDRLSAKEYRAELTVQAKRHDQARTDLEKLRKAKSGAAIRKGLLDFVAVEELFAGDVGKLKPPKNAEKPHALLVLGALDLVAKLNTSIGALAVTKSPRPALKRLKEVRHAKGAAEEARALSQLKKLGYINEG
jgi:hypothetical protein